MKPIGDFVVTGVIGDFCSMAMIDGVLAKYKEEGVWTKFFVDACSPCAPLLRQLLMHLEAEVGQSGQKLILLPAVVAHLLRHQQRAPKYAEAGGQLFGRTQNQRILIEEATGPRMVDKR